MPVVGFKLKLLESPATVISKTNLISCKVHEVGLKFRTMCRQYPAVYIDYHKPRPLDGSYVAQAMVVLYLPAT
jgi:hypothetical protein